jgi:hypothetical protein
MLFEVLKFWNSSQVFILKDVRNMKKDFVIIPRKPTSKELLERLIDIVPSFSDFWQKDDNLFVNEGGKFSIHGVFSQFSAYLRDNFIKLKESKRRQLFAFIEECVKEDPHYEVGVSNAACTCFLENPAGEGELSESILKYLG